MDQCAYIGLGSNLGNRLGFLNQALQHLDTRGVQVLQRSRVYQTAPLLVTHQPNFLNATIQISTVLDPIDALDVFLEIESRLGRQRGERFGPRTIDLDILLWGREGEITMSTDRLILPHPRLAERAFALVPLAELAGDLVHPLCLKTIGELARKSDRSGIELFADQRWVAASAGRGGSAA